MSDSNAPTSAPSTSTAEHHGVGHVAPIRVLVATGLGLIVLTWITVVVAGIELGEFNIFAALAIACVKGSLVALFFMHLRWDRPFNAIILVSSLAFVALFISMALIDTAEYQETIEPGDAKAVVEKIATQD